MEMGKHAINLSQYGARALPLLADVARGARSYRLVSSDLSEAVHALLALVGDDVVWDWHEEMLGCGIGGSSGADEVPTP
jgi:hypothetical protein